MKKPKKTLLGIFLLALVLRSLVLIVALKYPDRTISNDTPTYVHPANSLLEGQGYTFPGAFRTPVYPLFLAFFFWLFGQHLTTIVVVQVIISSLNVLLTYWAGALILPKRVSLIGAFLIALSLESITGPFFILTDTLFAFLFLGAAYVFLRYRSTKRITWLISSGILTGLSILCRPIALYYPAAVVVLLFFIHWKEWLTLVLKSLVYLAVVFCLPAAWYLRTYVQDGAPILTTIANYDLLFYNAASLDASLHGGTVNDYGDNYQGLVQEKLTELGLARTEANLDKVYKILAKDKILAHPLKFVIIQLKYDLNNLLPGWSTTLEILSPTGQGEGIQGAEVLKAEGLSGIFQTYFEGRLWLVLLFLPFTTLLVIIYLGDVIGTFFLVRKKEWFVLAVLIFPIAYLLLLPGATSSSRFRLPAMPAICLIAGLGIDWTWSALHRKRKSAKSLSVEKAIR